MKASMSSSFIHETIAVTTADTSYGSVRNKRKVLIVAF